MPELPDVEGICRRLARRGMGRRVLEVFVYDSTVLRNAAPEGFGLTSPGVAWVSRCAWGSGSYHYGRS